MVHQELAFLPLLTIAENLYVRHYADKKKKLVSWKDMESSAQKALEMIDLEIDQNMPIGNCSVAECQQIEIARAVYENAKILILDEPTSALNDRETDALMECIRKLRKKGSV